MDTSKNVRGRDVTQTKNNIHYVKILYILNFNSVDEINVHWQTCSEWSPRGPWHKLDDSAFLAWRDAFIIFVSVDKTLYIRIVVDILTLNQFGRLVTGLLGLQIIQLLESKYKLNFCKTSLRYRLLRIVHCTYSW